MNKLSDANWVRSGRLGFIERDTYCVDPKQINPVPEENIYTSALDVQVGGDHYKNWKIQPIEFITKNKIPFIEACIIKYACRWKDKNGVEDLKKIKHYVDLLIDLEEL